MNWTWVLFAVVACLILGRLAWLLSELIREARFLDRGRAPSAVDIRGSTIAKRSGHFDWLVQTIRPKAEAGTLQEEPVLVALEDRLVHGTQWLRELSAICILSALALTFYKLNKELPGIINNKTEVTPQSLQPLISLVGANWSLIVAGLASHVASIGERWISLKRFDVYRQWLERDIFPFLGVARTTGDRLAAALESFSGTVIEVKKALYPLSGLATVMAGFQEGLIGEMIPAMTKGLEGVKIGLSDGAVHELRATTVESARALREMKDHQARMLTLIVSGERRTAEMASVVQSIADQTSQVAKALKDQIPVLTTNNESLTQLKTAVAESTESSGTLTTTIKRLNESTVKHTQRVDANISALSALEASLPEISATLSEMRKLMSGVSLGLTSLAVSENSLRTEMEQSRGAVKAATTGLTAFLDNAAALKERWEEAMLQMASLADEVSRRTIALDKSTTELSAVAGAVVARLPQIESALNSVGAHIEKLSGSTAEIANGNKSLVAAFGELQTAGQKLKHLGHEITGHFNIWQEQTRKVFKKAQDSTESIESSFTRIAGMVSGMEAVLRQLAEVVARTEANRTRESESAGARPNG
jgi:ABC-type transporter Mla subunit MlaD